MVKKKKGLISVKQLFIYPVKSLSGISLQRAQICLNGFKHDREWMITDSDYQFVTQRQIESMATIRVEIDSAKLTLHYLDSKPLVISLDFSRKKLVKATVWQDRCEAYDEGEEASIWLTRHLGKYKGSILRLVRFSPNERRAVPDEYLNSEKAQSAFSDQFPYLITSSVSLDYLNTSLALNGASVVAMDRFRANVVVDRLEQIEKKTLYYLKEMGGRYRFAMRKPCTRCKITTIQQDTGVVDNPKEPLATLLKLNLTGDGKDAIFGQNAIVTNTLNSMTYVEVGDQLCLNQ
ncbi:MAG: MOSC N-terminal beta barrel domain-containing protein [Gammaproteobacteria bacterium]|nr:MOSC N-terminal beta barrel domain-containing protein [Gammaproteobacteria bacterium]